MYSRNEIQNRLYKLMKNSRVVPNSELYTFQVDGCVPNAVVMPVSENELSDILAEAYRKVWTVVPWGSGSSMKLGNLSPQVDLVVGTTGIENPIDYSPSDLTVTVGAGTKFSELQSKLAKGGHWLPIDPPLGSVRTLGGILATNLVGPLSFGYGTVRDYLLGLRVAESDGTVTKSGGRVVKNVTGFDLTKLHIGALGTLGVILEANLKVIPLPKCDKTLSVNFDGWEAGIEAFALQSLSTYSGQAAELIIAPDGGTKGYIRFLGSDSSVEVRVDHAFKLLTPLANNSPNIVAEEQAANVWYEIENFGWSNYSENGGDVIVKFGCSPSKIDLVIKGIFDYCIENRHSVEMIVGPGRGVIKCKLIGVASVLSEAVTAFRKITSESGGYAVVELAPTSSKKNIDVWGYPGIGLPLMRRLKEKLDPNGILNVGRYVEGL